jgi:hypothetical protein
MYIDDCQHTFEELVQTVLPVHMEKLRLALTKTQPASRFFDSEAGTATLARELGLSGDFSGCYVLLEGEKPIYVGISRKVLSRLRQHFKGKTHFDASLAYKIAQKRSPTPGHRSKVMREPGFQQAFADAQKYLRNLRVAFTEITNPVELHVFEAYAAMELHTSDWNTFRTH